MRPWILWKTLPEIASNSSPSLNPENSFSSVCVCVCVCVCVRARARARAFMYVDTIYTHNAYLCTYISVQRPEPNYSCNLARPDSARGAILGKVLGVHLSDVLLLLRLLLLELPQAAHHAPITARRRRKESRQPCKRQTPGTDAAEA